MKKARLALGESPGSFQYAHQNEMKLQPATASCRKFPDYENLLHKGAAKVESSPVRWADEMSETIPPRVSRVNMVFSIEARLLKKWRTFGVVI
jgi:hypothetical protein